MTEKCIPVGELVGTHGLTGWLKLKSFDPGSVSLFSARELSLVGGSKKGWYKLDQAKQHKRIFLIKLDGIDHVAVAEEFIGCEVWIRADTLAPLNEREYFHYDVLGFDVFDAHSNHVGKITSMWFTAGGDLYVVAGDNKEHLIPANKEIIEEVDFPRRRITVDLPEGLLEL